MSNRLGTVLMLLGLLSLTAAFSLCIVNISQEQNAGRESNTVLSALTEMAQEGSHSSTEDRVEGAAFAADIPVNTPIPQDLIPSEVEEDSAEADMLALYRAQHSQDDTVIDMGSRTNEAEGQHVEEPDAARYYDMLMNRLIGETDMEQIRSWIDDDRTAVVASISVAEPTAPDADAAIESTPEAVAVVTAVPEAAPATPAADRDAVRKQRDESRPALEQLPIAAANRVEVPDHIRFPEMEMPEIIIDGKPYVGMLQIPTLNLELPVMGDWSYPKLKIAPCRYSGTPYTGSFIVMAHNYVTHFGNIKNLKEGDRIEFMDVTGNVFVYQVVGTEILDPWQVKALERTEHALTLFTCTVGGATRVVVRCDRCE